MKKSFLLLTCFVSLTQAQFQTLDDLKYYAAHYQEAPSTDNNSWTDPDFSSFYKNFTPSFLKRMINLFGISYGADWQAEQFKALLQRVTKVREEAKKNNGFVEKIQIKTGSRCIVFGDLHGSFHSLVRSLCELKRLGIINNELKIVSDEVCIVFLGDLVSRSPYSLETLTIALLLMDRNPDHVIYIRGNHEKNAYWENFSMRRALRARARHLAIQEDGAIPIRNDINKFFKTLPKALLIQHEHEKKESIYCAHSSIGTEAIQGSEVEAVILGEKRLEVIRPTSGLEFLGFDHGTAQWSLLSCPNRVYQDFFKFYYDAFAVIEMGTSVVRSILTLYNQDIRGLGGFKSTHFDIIFGNQLKSKIDSAEAHRVPPFKFGSTLAATGSLSSLGGDVERGIDAAVHDQNQEGGIKGQYIRPFIFDDEYVPRFARKNIDKLVKDYGIDIILAPVGSPTLASYVQRALDDEVVVLFPYTGGPQFRTPDVKNIIHFRSSYADEARVLIDYMISEYGVKTFAFFYQDDAYGTGPLESAHEELRKRGIDTWTDIPYTREQIDFKPQAELLKKSNADAIGFFSTSTPTQELLGKLGSDFLIGRQLFGISFLETEDLRRFLDNRGIPFAFSYAVPNPDTSDLQIVQEYRKAMDERGLPYESNSLEGYIAAQLLIDAFSKIDSPVTKEKITQWFEGMKDYVFKGLTLTFNPAIRGFGEPVWLRTVEGKWIAREVEDR